MVGTVSVTGVALYVDGVQVASALGLSLAVAGTSYWRAGSVRLTGLPNAPAVDGLTGSIDEVAVYPSTLSAARVAAHYAAR